MRLVVERVKEAKCIIKSSIHSEIKSGMLVYVGFTHTDTIDTINKAIDKLLKLRIFSDENGKINENIEYINGSILLISSFSLYGDVSGTNRPSFTKSMSYNEASKLYEYMSNELSKKIDTKLGIFGADMEIYAINDGPVSLVIDY